MRDLELWRRLTAGDAVPADLLALAAWPLERRAPYLGAIEPLAHHPDAAMRAAALRALGGVRGVPGVRAIVDGLEHVDESVRAAALDALRATARDAPSRFAHALFHPRAEIRRAALAAELPPAAADLGAYLRADPHCADLAARCPWPADPLALAFDLHAMRHLSSAELVELVLATPTADLRAFLEAQRGRAPALVEAYLDAAVRSPSPLLAPGRDLLDHLVAALDAAGNARAFDHFIEAVTARRRRLARRAAASLLSRLASGGASAALVGVCVALEPRVLRCAGFDRALAAAAAAGLVRFRWPVRPTTAQIDRLVALPVVRGGEGEGIDLALAAALAGLWPGNRLARLVAALGEESITGALLAGDRGWDEVCRLPREKPALELAWLQRIEQASPRRYVALAARALAWFAGDRLDAFVDQMPRQHRVAAFLELVALAARGELVPGAAQLASVCRAFAARLDRSGLAAILASLLGDDGAACMPRLAFELAGAVSDKLLVSAARLLDDRTAAGLVDAIDSSEGLAWERELSLAGALADRAEPLVRDWSARIVRAGQARPAAQPPVVRARRPLNQAERERIATCSDDELERALEPALGGPVTGVTVALERRAASPSVPACVALLGCVDPLDDVVRELDRFAAATPDFDGELDAAAAARWPDAGDLPLLAHARLHRWEAHRQALLRWIDEAGGVRDALATAEAMPGRVAARSLWRAIGEALAFLRYRDRPRFIREASAQLAERAADHIDGDVGPHAARILVVVIESGAVPLAAVRDRILDRAADSVAEAREHLARLIRLEGLPEPPPMPATPPTEAQRIAAIRQSRDLDELCAACADARRPVVEAAVLRLLVLGAPGQDRLAGLLPRLAELPAPAPLITSIPLWESPAARDAARQLAAAADLPPELRFRLHLGLVALGHTDEMTGALASARAPDDTAWFRRADWQSLVRRADPLACAIALADSPHHHAYQPAIALLLAQAEPTPEVGAALRRFLEVDDERPLELRRQVALRLGQLCADLAGLPLLIEQLAEVDDAGLAGCLSRMPAAAWPVAAPALTAASLVGGSGACSEKRLLAVLRHVRTQRLVDAAPMSGLYARILDQASTALARRESSTYATEATRTEARLHMVGQVFAWGVRRAFELTGRLLRVHMTGQEREFGHTRLDTSRINVSPLPMLRGDPNGQDVVEGLILHEIGHHVYHGSDESQALWKQAHQEGLGPLLNLVADEHLERNLRAVDGAYGDRLKRLAAYAFQHAAQEIPLEDLMACLVGSTAPALIAARIEVAFNEASVRLRRGSVLAELDRIGHPLARFSRALRMGLGNRHGDPLVAEALDLCGDIRRLDMQGLYDLTHKLADLFGGAAAVAAVFGGPEGLVFGEREGDVFGGDLGDDAVQREVERVLDPHGDPSDAPPGNSDRLRINVGESARFDEIKRIEKVRGDEAAHRRIAAEVARHSSRLRAFLDELGLRWLPTRGRIQGRAVDRSRLRHLITRGDPRILIARQSLRRTDLFLGTLVDCSGSMAGANLERARRFAVLIAEAVRPLPGVEARFFGFTDSVIYDAGDAAHCGVSALQASGGNNDAAALLHAAKVAMASRRQARVLVMISDGLPTQCSVVAVRDLVTELTRRRGLLCAQVAVRPLTEAMFPDYIVLEDESEVAVARFGRMIGKLARRALAS